MVISRGSQLQNTALVLVVAAAISHVRLAEVAMYISLINIFPCCKAVATVEKKSGIYFRSHGATECNLIC
jgi:hypothetical protein